MDAQTELRRHPERAIEGRDALYAILDEGLVAHVGFIDGGVPVVIPTTYARVDDALYLHGASLGRLMTSLERGTDVCVTVTLLDGLVLARSAFNHSMNYRSVIVFGTPRAVDDAEEKQRAFAALVEHVVPGRSSDTRGPSDGELRATGLVALSLQRCSGKARTGPPKDASTDAMAPYWAGVLPARLGFGNPEPDGGSVDLPTPRYLRGYERRTAATGE